MNGVIRKLEATKYWGFIEGDDDRKSYFFHRDDFSGHWEDLETDWKNKVSIKVSFTPTTTQKGLRAEDIKRLDFPNQ